MIAAARVTLTALVLACIGTAPLRADVPRVATDIPPVHALVAQVMQGIGAPDLILPPGASPHDHAMRPSEAAILGRAELVIFVGGGLTPWLEGPLTALAAKARQVELMAQPGVLRLPLRSGALLHRPDEMPGPTDPADPHGWLDPGNARLWLDVIASALAQSDPANAARYRDNATTAAQQITALEGRLTQVLGPLNERGFVVYHDAFQYFESAFGLRAAAAITADDSAEPSPARIAEVRAHVAEQGVRCVFSEPQFNPGLVAAVLPGAGTRIAAVDPMGAALTPGPDLYGALLTDLAEALADCLAPD